MGEREREREGERDREKLLLSDGYGIRAVNSVKFYVIQTLNLLRSHLPYYLRGNYASEEC